MLIQYWLAGLVGARIATRAILDTQPPACIVWRRQTHYALANLLVGALAVKGLGTYARPARASCNYSCSTNQIAAFSKLAFWRVTYIKKMSD